MKKVLKSFMCCVLAVITVMSSASVAFAKNDVTPVIVIHGMNASALYHNPGTEEETAVEEFNIASILGTGGLLSQLLAVCRGDDANTEKIMQQIADFMLPYQDIACDENGNSIDVGVNNYWTDSVANHRDYLEGRSSNEPAIARQVADKIGAENVYAFNYDWRLDVCETAKKLSSFIDEVKAQTGKSKVTVVSASEGTMVVSAYIDAYKSKNDVKRYVFVNGAFNGVYFTKAYKQDLYFDQETVMEYLRTFCLTFRSADTDLSSLKLLVGFIDDAVGNLCDYLNEIISNPTLLNRLYNEVLTPLGKIPAMWECIAYEDFDESVDKMSSIGFLDKSSGLYSKILHYHHVQGRLKSNLTELKNKGVEIAVVANYGIPVFPITSAYANQSDYLIDTKLASLNATVANYGAVLDRSGKYVSPDKVIDASTCLFPDNTWFVKGVKHVGFCYGTEAMEFLTELITTDSEPNVASVEKKTGVGQFIGTDKDQNIIAVTDDRGTLGVYDISAAKAGEVTDTAEKKSPPTGNYTAVYIALTAAFTAAAFSVTVSVFVKRKKKCR